MGCQRDLKKDYHKWIEVSCFMEGASTREVSLGSGAASAPPATWVNPPCRHDVAESSASLAARLRLAHGSSNAPQSHGMKDTVVLFLLVCQNVILQESLRGIQDCERPHWRCGKGDVFRWTSLEKCRVNYQWYMCPLSLSLGCLESFTQIHLIFCCP